MSDIKRQSPPAQRDREARKAPLPPTISPQGDIGHDDSGIANDRQTEDDRAGRPLHRSGWNDNT